MSGDSEVSKDSSHSGIVMLESVMSDSTASKDSSDSRTDILESISISDSQVSKDSSDSRTMSESVVSDSQASKDSSDSRTMLESVVSDSQASKDSSDSRTMSESVVSDSQASKDSSDSRTMLESVMSDSQASKDSNKEEIDRELPIYINEKLLHIFVPEKFLKKCTVFSDKVYRIDNSVFVENVEVENKSYVQFELYAKKLHTEFEDEESTGRQSSTQTNEDDITDESTESEDINDTSKIFIDFENLQYENIMKITNENENITLKRHEAKKPTVANPPNVAIDLNCNSTDVDAQNENESTVSYAMMAKKPKAAEPPDHVAVVLNNQKYRVKYDIYHMLLIIHTNQLYCMLCKETFYIPLKQSHCENINHLMRLSEARVLETYEGYFIRIVDEKYYHCAHCNNLQPEFNLLWHLQTEHPKPNVENKTVTPENKQNLPLDPPIEPTAEPVAEPTNNGNLYTLTDFPVNHYVFYHIFNYYRRIPFLGYHGILPQQDRFFCGLCKAFFFPQHMSSHVNSPSHIWCLSQNPFLLQYSFHLIRQINFDLHCAVCNHYIMIEEILYHINSAYHLTLLRTSYAVTSAGLPLNVPQAVLQVVQAVPTMMQSSSKLQSPKLAEVTPKAQTSPKMTQTSPKRIHMAEVSFIEAQTSPIKMLTSLKMTQTSPKRTYAAVSSKEAQTSPKATQKLSKVTQTSPKKAHVGEIPPKGAQTSPKRAQVAKVSPSTPPKETQTSPEVTQTSPKRAHVGEISPKEPETSPEVTQTSPKRAHVAEVSPRTLETSPKETQTSPKVAHVTPNNAQILPEVNVDFNTEDYVYVFLENTYYKILKTSYHSFVCIGDGTRYCFVCSTVIFKDSLSSHSTTLDHENNLRKYRYLKGKVEHMLRQNNQLYHCSICNVLFDGKNLDNHLQWVRHVDLKSLTRNTNKKTRFREIMAGTTIVNMDTQKEKSYKHEEQQMKIAVFCDEDSRTSVEFVEECEKVIYRRRNETLELDFYAWHSLKMKFNMYQCQLCQVNMKMEEIDKHIALSSHLDLVSILVERRYRVFMRKVNNRIHCLICNLMLPSDTPELQSHSNSESHNVNYDFIVTVNKTY